MPRRRHLRGLAVLAVVGLLAGCWLSPAPEPTPSPTTTPSPAETVDADLPKELVPFYTQAVAWTECGEFECATFEVPLDYDDPAAASITLAMKRLPASGRGERLGSLVINPGGPGVAAMPYVDAASSIFTADVRAAYDIVGLDPRGVGESAPIECVDDQRIDELRAAVYPETPEGLAALRADIAEFAAACAENSAEVLGHVDTVSAARDLDVLRALLGQERLDYLGFSYGTLLGATYAGLFEERTGRLVLDGGLDPALSLGEVAAGQAEGFEGALRAYAEDCLPSRGCPLSGSVDDAMSQIDRFLELLVGTPLPTGSDRELTQSLAVDGILYTLYDDALWPVLTEALTAAMRQDDGSVLLYLADFSIEREADGTYASNLWAAFQAITCVDHPVDATLEDMDAEAARLADVAPTLGPFFAYSELGCEGWPVDPVGEPGPVSAPGAAPILVIGTTGDPATPYAWSQALAEQLTTSALLTYDGEGHTAYMRSNTCITDAVDGFLTTGELPEDGLVC